MTTPTGNNNRTDKLSCLVDHRRSTLREHGWNGIDYVEVDEGQRRLEVTLIARAPEGLGVGNLKIEGGLRIRDLRIVDVRTERHDDPNIDDQVVVEVDRPGDFSTYRLCFVESDDRGRPTDVPLAGFDPRYACVDVDFKASCPSELDCAEVDDCPPEDRTNVAIDYLARDWDGLRRIMFDRLSLLVPGLSERHIPDIGVTLVELLAYIGDRLSYYQDAVATEAYLETARKRVSVRRHTRLVDYHLHEGCNARAWVCLVVSDTVELDSALVAVAALDASPSTSPMTWDAMMATAPASRVVFEPTGIGTFSARPEHNRIRFYTWGGHECCIAVGTTRATLVDGWADQPDAGSGDDDHYHDQHNDQHGGCDEEDDDDNPRERLLDLHPGDVLIFEEVIGPETGLGADADPRHRHAVCLTEVELSIDPVTETPIVEIAWHDHDALPFPLCLSTDEPPPDCEPLTDVSVACGNVMLVDQGITINEDLGEVPLDATDTTCGDDCNGPHTAYTPGRFRPVLVGAPVTHCADVNACPAADALEQDPHVASPHLIAHQVLAGAEPGPGVGLAWTAVRDLLGSDADDRHLVVEVDERRCATLRFGDGRSGSLPGAGSYFSCTYRIGNGREGNVGAGAINRFVTKGIVLDGISIAVRNPLPAIGGTEPEDVEHARLRAPSAFRGDLARAITPDDYSSIVERDFAEVQAANAVFRFTGSRDVVVVAVDQFGRAEADPELLSRISLHLDRFRRIGHEVIVQPAIQVALRLSLVICVESTFLRSPVELAAREALSARRNRDGSLGFFHPDRRSFGGAVALSDIVSKVHRIEGVDGVIVRQLHRRFEPPMGELEAGVLNLSALEIARLDNDPSLPEHGVLEIEMRGGR